MKVLLVWPSVGGAQLHGFLPLGLGCLAANLPGDFEVHLWDGVLDRLPNASIVQELERFRPDAVGISVWNFNLLGTREVVAAVRQRCPGLPIVAGGPTVCGYGERALDVVGADYAFAGEGERPFCRFLELLRDGQLSAEAKRQLPGLIYRDEAGRATANPPRWEPLDDLKSCDYGLIRLNDYLARGYQYGMHPKARRTAPVATTRGCPFPCKFCGARLINGPRVRCRPVESVVAEIRMLHERFAIDGFNIIDDNFTFDRDYAKRLCRAILGLGLRDVSFCSPNGVKMECLDEELLGLMKQVGWHSVFIAPESGSERTLAAMRKHVDLSAVEERIRVIQRAGLRVLGFFIIGYPGETAADIRRTLAYARRMPFDAVTFTCFQPLPGTPVTEELLASGELGNVAEGTDYYQVSYAPKGLTPRQLRRWRLWGLLRFYTSSFPRLWLALRSYSLRRILMFLGKLLR
jgi:radical SAM superfamily enzyme YgiQ (UPF0313 family)